MLIKNIIMFLLFIKFLVFVNSFLTIRLILGNIKIIIDKVG